MEEDLTVLKEIYKNLKSEYIFRQLCWRHQLVDHNLRSVSTAPSTAPNLTRHTLFNGWNQTNWFSDR